VIASGGEAQWQNVLGIEWGRCFTPEDNGICSSNATVDIMRCTVGGMNDALWQLAALTGDAQWADAAGYFNHWAWTAPLAAGEDDLAGNHANTQYVVLGDACRFIRVSKLSFLSPAMLCSAVAAFLKSLATRWDSHSRETTPSLQLHPTSYP
jgi:hypothetical protein